MRNLMLFSAFAAVTLLCGCGQKGPLVLPDAQKHKPISSAPVAAPAPPPPAAAPAPATTPTPTPTP
jgi:predicted small lipoprotein YifL